MWVIPDRHEWLAPELGVRPCASSVTDGKLLPTPAIGDSYEVTELNTPLLRDEVYTSATLSRIQNTQRDSNIKSCWWDGTMCAESGCRGRVDENILNRAQLMSREQYLRVKTWAQSSGGWRYGGNLEESSCRAPLLSECC